jgi:site-specific DNA recombinase
VQLWLPEAHGPIGNDDPAHQALVLLLGAQSRREGVAVPVSHHGSDAGSGAGAGPYLGGRPPYGYRLVDAGPHPNAVHAEWGRRLRRLEPDPTTAPPVRWIFQERLAGRSVAGIARALNEEGMPCPSIMDHARNRHR